MYYAFIQNNKINGIGQVECLNSDVQNIEITEEVYNDIDRYIWDGEAIILDPDYDEKQRQKERERIQNLHMTRGDVFRGLLLAKGVTRADIRSFIELMPEDTPEQRVSKEYALIDFDEALEFYRGVALIDTLGMQLGITPHQMDRFFDTKDWHELVTEGGK
jgi:hypothetical protein